MALVGVAHAESTKALLHPQRIVSLAPSLTELVYAAGAGSKLIAVSAFSDFPLEAKALPVVADYAGVNMEALLALKPDLVLAWPSGTKRADIDRLRALHIRVEEIGIAALSELAPAIERIGALAGTQSRARAAIDTLQSRRLALQKRYPLDPSKPAVLTFIEIGRTPMMTVNSRHFIAEIVRLCGGVGVFDGESALVFQPSREALLAKNPALVIHGTSARSRQRENNIYNGTRALKSGQIRGIEADHLLRPGPRLIDAAEAVCAAIEGAR